MSKFQDELRKAQQERQQSDQQKKAWRENIDNVRVPQLIRKIASLAQEICAGTQFKVMTKKDGGSEVVIIYDPKVKYFIGEHDHYKNHVRVRSGIFEEVRPVLVWCTLSYYSLECSGVKFVSGNEMHAFYDQTDDAILQLIRAGMESSILKYVRGIV